MSNRQSPRTTASGSFKLADFRAEAVGEPFPLELDDGTTIEVPRPTGNQMFDVEDAARAGNSRLVLEIMCGDTAEAFIKAVGSEDAAVLKKVSEAMQKHFGLGN